VYKTQHYEKLKSVNAYARTDVFMPLPTVSVKALCF